MMETLFERAGRYHEQRKASAATVQKEIAGLKEQLTKKQQELEAINFTPELLANYRGRLGYRYYCPGCWILSSSVVWLEPIPSDTQEDVFRCDKCNTDFSGVDRGRDGYVFEG